MKKMFFVLFILFMFLSHLHAVDFRNTGIFGSSFNYQANQELWEGALDLMQRTEYYSSLCGKDILYFNYDNYPTIGINKAFSFGAAIFLFQFYDDSLEMDGDEDIYVINMEGNYFTETRTSVDSSVDRTINAGIGFALFESLGLNYTLNWVANSIEEDYTTITSYRSNEKSRQTQSNHVKSFVNNGVFNNE